MRTFIAVRTEFDAMHQWKDAPKEVEFLKYPHRHKFYVKMELEVHHNDREVEFFMLQRDLIKSIDHYITEFGMKSCEMLAQQLVKDYANYKDKKRYCTVDVYEDNENGGIATNCDETL